MATRPGFKKFRKLVETDIDALRAEFAQLRTDLDAAQRQIESMASTNEKVIDEIRSLDDRLSHMGREFANQIHEMATGIDKLEKHADSVSAETISELQGVQARLATEQVRYEIAFRQDLAEIADQLRRSR